MTDRLRLTSSLHSTSLIASYAQNQKQTAAFWMTDHLKCGIKYTAIETELPYTGVTNNIVTHYRIANFNITSYKALYRIQYPKYSFMSKRTTLKQGNFVYTTAPIQQMNKCGWFCIVAAYISVAVSSKTFIIIHTVAIYWCQQYYAYAPTLISNPLPPTINKN